MEGEKLFMKKIIIVGAGLGGLSCAIRLAYHGFSVTVMEKQSTIGGKLQQVTAGEYQFDLGPSTITMRHIFEELFTACDRNIEDYVSFYPIATGTRNFFSDGQVVDFNTDQASVAAQIATYSPEDAQNYHNFLREASRLYTIAERSFFKKLMYSTKAKLSTKLLTDFLRIKPHKTLHQLTRQFFRHPNTLAMFDRYATYVGSSPYQAPAIFAMMAHLEGRQGIYGMKGGTYALVQGLEKLALELGVSIQTNVEVKQLLINENRQTIGVATNVGEFFADDVIANADALTVQTTWFNRPEPQINNVEPSLSGLTILLGTQQKFASLSHHNVFFPSNYQAEFEAIFKEKCVPSTPTIYICNSSVSEPTRAKPDASNLFMLVNAPYMTNQAGWSEDQINYIRSRVFTQLQSFGLQLDEATIDYEEYMTPADIAARTGAYKGTIYGMSSNYFKQAFFRMPNKDRSIDHLYYVGGSTHPGGGTPMVTLSGMLVADDIIERYR